MSELRFKRTEKEASVIAENTVGTQIQEEDKRSKYYCLKHCRNSSMTKEVSIIAYGFSDSKQKDTSSIA